MVLHTCNHTTGNTGQGRKISWMATQPSPISEFQAVERPCIRKQGRAILRNGDGGRMDEEGKGVGGEEGEEAMVVCKIMKKC